MSAINAFDRIAPFYDSLHRLVFGKAIDKSQLALLGSIAKESKVLIIGGGTGRTLEGLLTVNEGCRVWYIEASSVMLARARARIGARASSVIFIHGSEDAIPTDVAFDAVITGFFLDLFPEVKVGELARKIGKQHLGKNGLWLITDFVDRGKWWQHVFLWSMYRFFVFTCGIAARKLPAWEHQVSRYGFHEKETRFYFSDFIKSSVWVNSPDENRITTAL